MMLSPDQVFVLSVVAYWVGAFARVLWPYILKKVQTGEKFDWRYAVGQGLTTLGLFFVALTQVGFVESLGSLGIVGGFLVGFAAASMGRNGQKTVDVARGK